MNGDDDVDVTLRGVDELDVYIGEGSDTISGTGGPVVGAAYTVRMWVFAAEGDDAVAGGTNDDDLEGFIGDDVLRGDDGNDTIDGSVGDDSLFGGPGIDVADYSNFDALGGVNVNLFERTATGAQGTDTVLQMENIRGSFASDRLIGSVGPNRIDGSAGKDLVNGHRGADVLIGGLGDDSILGLAGGDHLRGGNGSDVLDGGAGPDVLRGGPGKDSLRGGPGFDVCVVDPLDTVLGGCDRIVLA